jgi:uncharacterized membrane protein YhaH (DUF805 family)
LFGSFSSACPIESLRHSVITSVRQFFSFCLIIFFSSLSLCRKPHHPWLRQRYTFLLFFLLFVGTRNLRAAGRLKLSRTFFIFIGVRTIESSRKKNARTS